VFLVLGRAWSELLGHWEGNHVMRSNDEERIHFFDCAIAVLLNYNTGLDACLVSALFRLLLLLKFLPQRLPNPSKVV
jgi:hypothetical protein